MKDKNKKPAASLLQSPRGMHDLLPQDAPLFEKLRSVASEIAEFYGFGYIETPLVEHAALYERGVGGATDIVEKETYTFRTKGGDLLALRPEGTVGVARAYAEHGMQAWPQPVKLWYWGPMFRHDAPQALRYRQFRHAGFECLGEDHPAIDAEMIQLTYRILEEFGVKSMRVEISSIGCKECRPAYRNALKAFYRQKARRLCADCRRRMIENPLRLLDCKEEACRLLREGAPEMVERLCEPCRLHFKQVLGLLDDLGYPYLLNPFLVRGLDYYNRTVFEILAEDSPAPNFGEGLEPFSGDAREASGKGISIAGGGRFDYLLESIGGPQTAAVGAAIGVERAIAFFRRSGAKLPTAKIPNVFLVQLGEVARAKALALMEQFRKEGIGLATSLGRDSIKAQLKAADRLNVTFALIIGQKEAADDNVILRDMQSGAQETIPVQQIVEILRQRLRKAKGST